MIVIQTFGIRYPEPGVWNYLLRISVKAAFNSSVFILYEAFCANETALKGSMPLGWLALMYWFITSSNGAPSCQRKSDRPGRSPRSETAWISSPDEVLTQIGPGSFSLLLMKLDPPCPFSSRHVEMS